MARVKICCKPDCHNTIPYAQDNPYCEIHKSMCSLYGTYRMAETDVQKNGIFVSFEVDKKEIDEETGEEVVVGKETQYDRSKKNPAYSIMNDSIKTLKSLAVDLGLSFDARSGQLVPSEINVAENKKDDLRLVKFGADI